MTNHTNMHYHYRSLDSEQRQIRLVTLEPGAWSNPICCTIKTVFFDSKPEYDALSYVWGDAKNLKTIRLDDHPFEVTENLWIVLRRLRDPNIHLSLWIDAICINQMDKAEKSQQVAMMGEIYSSCLSTRIWLGEDADVSETGSKSVTAYRACEMLDILGDNKHFYDLACFVTNDDGRAEIAQEYAGHFEAFHKFVDVAWWKRIWVVQEMVLPKKLRFHYASEEFSYETLKSVVQGLQVHGLTCCKQHRYTLRAAAFNPILTFQEQVEPMVLTRETWTHQTPTTLFHLRRLFSAFKATERRDLFYALLGLVTSWGTGTPLYPNYGIPLKEAITQAVFKCVSEQGGLSFLQGERMFHGQKEDMPSWIPDAHFASAPSQWVIVEQRRLRMYSGFSSSGSLRQDAALLSLDMSGALHCQSLPVDKIAKVGPVCEVLERFEDTPDVFRQWMEMIGIGMRDWPTEPPEAKSMKDVFWRTILNDSVELDTGESPYYRRPNDADYSGLASLWEWFLGPLGGFIAGMVKLQLSNESHDEVMSKAPATVYHLFVCLEQRLMFVTECGWIGLASRQANIGDEIHILLGSPAPFLLRPIKAETSTVDDQAKALPHYSIIGNGYLHNIMSGEAFEDDGERNIQTIVLH